MVKIFPKEATHKKKETLEGTLGFQILLHGCFTLLSAGIIRDEQVPHKALIWIAIWIFIKSKASSYLDGKKMTLSGEDYNHYKKKCSIRKFLFGSRFGLKQKNNNNKN